ncbi:putative ABC exporter domain-containing protein [Clostridium sp.]|uniref:putative ABC exporter domain-containing protein n=1 Tax=Clostridium sp. TaxID=1506 RepID=UPI003216F9A8
MKGIIYLWRTTLKNQIKDLKNHPGKLIGYIIIIALMVFVFISSAMTSNSTDGKSLRSMSELGAIIYALFMFLFISQIIQGLSSGATFFKMADVNLLFVSPVSSKKVLIYGLVRQLGMSLLISIFILFQAGVLNQMYGVKSVGVIVIFIGYFVLTFISSIMSMAIYSITSGNEKKKKIAKVLIYILVLPVVISILLNIKGGGRGIEAIANGINEGYLEYIPFVGWLKALIYGALIGENSNALIYIILIILGIGLTILILMKSKNEYYEDVLQATETMYKRKEDAKEGRIVDTKDTKKIKLKNSGINKGRGASVFFFKHMLENKRAGKFFLDNTTLIQIVIVAIFTLTMKEVGSIVATFAMATYIQLFLTFTGRWVRELKMHYIYLIPESPLKKLLYIVSESLIKCVIDGIIIFIIAGIILGSSPIEILVCIVARFGFGMLFIAGDVLSQKIFKQVTGKGLLMLLTILALIILALPGIIGAVVLAIVLELGTISIIATFIWNIFISFIIMWLCKNILNNIEQNLV